MSGQTAYERALREQIAFLTAELERVLAAQVIPPAALPTEDDPPIEWALRDPGFRQWLLKRQLEERTYHGRS